MFTRNSTSAAITRLRSVVLGTLAAATLSFALGTGSAAAQPFALPFWADDLKPGERLFTRDHAGGDQRHGYDITARRILPDGRWTALRPGGSSDRNEDHLIYGMPIHAIADGEVIACWRNAPDNLAPGVQHPARAQGLIGGGGNMLKVAQDNGVVTLYAHTEPASISSALCPHDAELLSAPGATHELDVPEGQRARIRKGQLIGRVGNSGRSSGPHLHVHSIKDGDAFPLTFERGLATPWNGGNADIDSWTSFAGGKIPDGEVLLWPPRRLGGEYARHRFPREDYGRLFLHLVDSGYEPVWFDGYSVGNRTFYNFVWRPASRPFRAWRDLSAATYQDRLEDALDDGFAPVHVESYRIGNSVRFALIVEKGVPGRFLARHGLDAAQHQAVLQQAKDANLNPVDVSVVSVNGERRFTVLYRSNNIGSWVMRSRVREADYQDMFEAQAAAGRLPRYVGAYMHEGEPHFSVVFASSMAGGVGFHGMSSQAYQDRFEQQTGQGRRTRVVSAFDGASTNHRFVGIWK